jgi:hypothetical protein
MGVSPKPKVPANIKKGGRRMKCFRLFHAFALLAAVAAAGVPDVSLMAMGKGPDAPRMTVEDLRPLIGAPDVAVIDVRVGDEWAKSTEKIQGAVREDPEKYNQWAVKYPKEKTLVFY